MFRQSNCTKWKTLDTAIIVDQSNSFIVFLTATNVSLLDEVLTQVDHAAGQDLNKSSTPWDEEEEGEKEEVYFDYSARYIHSRFTLSIYSLPKISNHRECNK